MLFLLLPVVDVSNVRSQILLHLDASDPDPMLPEPSQEISSPIAHPVPLLFQLFSVSRSVLSMSVLCPSNISVSHPPHLTEVIRCHPLGAPLFFFTSIRVFVRCPVKSPSGQIFSTTA